MTTAPGLLADLDAIQSPVIMKAFCIRRNVLTSISQPTQPNYIYCRTQGYVELYIYALIPRLLFMEVIKHGCYGR